MPLRRLASLVKPAWALQYACALQRAVGLLLLVAFPYASALLAQHASERAAHQPAKADASPVPVLMLSDIHFEPFQDPAKLVQLRDASIEQWPAILNAPASPTQAADLQALQKACPVRGVDTGWPLFSSSLAQTSAVQPQPLFVTVSGDLLSHAFDCRFKALSSQATAEDISAFASRTVAFVAAQLRATFPNSPIYLALGNNDSGCTDYREDRHSSFLQHAAETLAATARTGVNEQAILRDFSDEGDYNIALPAPLRDARLLVLQDMFESEHYEPCDGKSSGASDAKQAAQLAQLDWLQSQLAQARAHHQHVWVMAHVPPGVDMYTTLSQKRNLCAGQAPAMFLSSEKIVDVLTSYADVVTLALFAHTHADEMRYLHAPGVAGGIPVKLVSSISPVNGNRPTFTVAEVEPRTAGLLDYTVYLLGDPASATLAAASKEYSFGEVYKFSSFSAGSLQSITANFLADARSSSPASEAYQRLYFPGDTGVHAAVMQIFWRTYACSLREDKPEAFRTCACFAAAPAK